MTRLVSRASLHAVPTADIANLSPLWWWVEMLLCTVPQVPYSCLTVSLGKKPYGWSGLVRLRRVSPHKWLMKQQRETSQSKVWLAEAPKPKRFLKGSQEVSAKMRWSINICEGECFRGSRSRVSQRRVSEVWTCWKPPVALIREKTRKKVLEGLKSCPPNWELLGQGWRKGLGSVSPAGESQGA